MQRMRIEQLTKISVLALALLLAAFVAVLAAGPAHAAANTFVVSSTGDAADENPGDGVCSTGGFVTVFLMKECTLRAAIQEIDVSPTFDETDTINFSIFTSDPNCDSTTKVCTISPATDLPAITGRVLIDGYTQDGASPNTLARGSNAALKIQLNGTNGVPTNVATSGLWIAGARNTVVRGLVINRLHGRRDRLAI